MIVSFDIDGCITQYPEHFLFLGRGVLQAGGTLHFVTARAETARVETIVLLTDLGLGELIVAPRKYLHMYPTAYDYPWTSDEAAAGHQQAHAAWKAIKCVELGVQLHYDDCAHNIVAIRQAGVPAFRVH